MAKKGYTPEQIINKHREAEVLPSHGTTLAIMFKKINVSDNTFCRWRREYGGLIIDQAQRLKDLEVENCMLSTKLGQKKGASLEAP